MEESVVFKRFSVTRPDGRHVMLRIQEISRTDVHRVIDFLCTYFLYENAFVIAAGILQCEKSLTELIGILKQMLFASDVMGLVCYVDDGSEEPEIAGCNAMRIYGKDDKLEGLENLTKQNQAGFGLNLIQKQKYDLIKELKVEKCLGGVSLSTHPDYRYCGIATELLKARLPLMERHGIPVTDAWFLSLGAQKGAAKAGYITVAEVTFEELGQLSGLKFTNVPYSMKLMILTSSYYKPADKAVVANNISSNQIMNKA